MQQKNPYIDPKLNKHKKNWFHNFNGGIQQFFKNYMLNLILELFLHNPKLCIDYQH